MGYIGRQISNLSDRVKLDSITASATATYNLLLNTVAYVPSSAESLTVSLNGVIQAPQDSYTVSGSTITFASTLSASDSIDFILAERGITLQTPSAGSVGLTQLSATGTKDATTFLRGDNTFASPSGFDITSITGATEDTTVPITTDEHIMNVGGALRRVDHNIVTAVNTPWFQARGLTSNQSIPNDTNTVITNWNNITINSKQDSGTSSQSMSSNGRFTFGVAGYYQINTSLTLDSVSSGKNIRIMIYSPHDDVTYIVAGQMTAASTATYRLAGSLVLPAGSSRYFEMQVYHNNGSTITVSQGSFSVFRIASYDLP
jgi:hypothetical protein